MPRFRLPEFKCPTLPECPKIIKRIAATTVQFAGAALSAVGGILAPVGLFGLLVSPPFKQFWGHIAGKSIDYAVIASVRLQGVIMPPPDIAGNFSTSLPTIPAIIPVDQTINGLEISRKPIEFNMPYPDIFTASIMLGLGGLAACFVGMGMERASTRWQKRNTYNLPENLNSDTDYAEEMAAAAERRATFFNVINVVFSKISPLAGMYAIALFGVSRSISALPGLLVPFNIDSFSSFTPPDSNSSSLSDVDPRKWMEISKVDINVQTTISLDQMQKAVRDAINDNAGTFDPLAYSMAAIAVICACIASKAGQYSEYYKRLAVAIREEANSQPIIFVRGDAYQAAAPNTMPGVRSFSSVELSEMRGVRVNISRSGSALSLDGIGVNSDLFTARSQFSPLHTDADMATASSHVTGGGLRRRQTTYSGGSSGDVSTVSSGGSVVSPRTLR